MMDHDSISYCQLTAAAQAQIRDCVVRAAAVSLFAFWQCFANRLHPTADDAGRRALDADQSRLLALLS